MGAGVTLSPGGLLELSRPLAPGVDGPPGVCRWPALTRFPPGQPLTHTVGGGGAHPHTMGDRALHTGQALPSLANGSDGKSHDPRYNVASRNEMGLKGGIIQNPTPEYIKHSS